MRLILLLSFLFSFQLSPMQAQPPKETKTIYIAAPLFSAAEHHFNATLAKGLRDVGYKLFVPQEEEPRELTSEAIFDMDKGGVDIADIVVAILDGPDPDSGTSWECGYAYGLGKPIITVYTDLRTNKSEGLAAPYNLMLYEASRGHVHISSLFNNIQDVIDAIDNELKKLF